MQLGDVEGYDEELPEDMQEHVPDSESTEGLAPEGSEGSEELPETEHPDSGADSAEYSFNKGIMDASSGAVTSDEAVAPSDSEESGQDADALELETGEGNTFYSEELVQELLEAQAEQEASVSAEEWEAYELLQEQYHRELVGHLESIRNLNICILSALGVVVGCLIVRQLSHYFR